MTRSACDNLLDELKRKHVDPVLTKLRGTDRKSWSFTGIDNGISRLEKAEYRYRAVGASKVRAEVFHEFQKVIAVVIVQRKLLNLSLLFARRKLLDYLHKRVLLISNYSFIICFEKSSFWWMASPVMPALKTIIFRLLFIKTFHVL